MNKKVLTLCAGVLLVSGSAVFTVNALNVGNEGPRTTYVAKANAEVAGYLLQQAGADDETAVWYLKENGKERYLAPDAEGDWFLDLSDGAIKKVAADKKNVTNVVLDKKVVSYKDEAGKTHAFQKEEGVNLYLWSDENTQIESAKKQTKPVILATSAEIIQDLDAQNQVVISVTTGVPSITLSETAYTGGESWEQAQAVAQVFTVETRETKEKETEHVLSFDVDGTTFYLTYTRSKFGVTTDKTKATAVSTHSTTSKWALKVSGTDYLCFADNAFSSTSASTNALRVLDAEKGGFLSMDEIKDGTKIYLTTGAYKDAFKEATDLKVITKASITVSALATGAQLAEDVKRTDAATALNTWTVKENKLTIQGKELSYTSSTGSLSLADLTKGGIISLTEEGQLAIAGVPVYIDSDKKVTTKATTGEDEDAVANTPAALYLVTEDGGVEAQPASTLVDGQKYIIAEKKAGVETTGAWIAKEYETIDATMPGAEYGKEDGISIDGEGVITITMPEFVPEQFIPVLIKNGDNYLGITGGKVTWGDKDHAVAWVLTGDGLVSLPDWKNDEPARYFAGIGAGLGEKGTNVHYGNSDTDGHSTITFGEGEPTDVIISLAGEGVPAEEIDNCNYPLIKSVSSDYVLLAFKNGGDVYYVKNVNGDLTTDVNEAGLWKVSKELDTNNNRFGYSFRSRNDENGDNKLNDYLTVGGASKFYGWDYTGGSALQLVAIGATGNLEFDITQMKLTLSSNPASAFAMYQSPIEQFTAQWLVHRYGSSFQLNFKDADDLTDYEWIGNVFEDADLVPVLYKNGKELVEVAPENDWSWRETASSFLLKDRNTGLYIVLDHTGGDNKYGNTHDFIDGGFPFDVLSESNIKKVLDGETVNNKEYYPWFRINYVKGTTEYSANGINLDNVTDGTAIKCIEVSDAPGASNSEWYDIVIMQTDDKAGAGHKDLFVTVENHCTHDDRTPDVSFQNEDNIVHGTDATNNPLLYKYVNITFKAGDKMQFVNENGNRVNLNNKVLGLNSKGKVQPSEANYFLFDKAEGQWIVTMTAANGLTAEEKNGCSISNTTGFTFTNRENGESIDIKAMHALGNDTYAVEYADREAFSEYPYVDRSGDIHYGNQANRDTLIIKSAGLGNTIATGAKGMYNTDSYANWTVEELQDKTFQLSIDAAAQLYVTENEGKGSHFLGLTANEADVTNWRLVPFTAARVPDVDAAKYLTQGTDSVYIMAHPQYFSGGKVYAYNDTTAIVAYALQNIANNEYLTYDPTQNQTIESMICDPNSKNFTTKDLNAAYRFVLKEKAEGTQAIESGKYNIIGVTPWGLARDKYVELYSNKDKDGNTITGEAYYELNLDNKLYGASTNNAIQVKGAYVEPTAVDIFTIATTASQEYAEPSLNDTIRIYGAEENDYVLYENGRFLNLGNDEGIAPAMVIDTAYVNRPGNNRYQYLLVVNHDYIEPVYDQLNGGDYHLVKPDTMKGRFLVNQIDSALFVSKNHNNKFINDIEADRKEVKLGFQWGYRTKDKLYLTDGQGGSVIDTLDLGTADFNKAKFAFKYVNQAVDETFKVQTAFYDYDAAVKAGSSKAAGVMNNEGYLKSENGVIVVTDGYTHGEEFLMAPEFSDPTANESINANGAVSVTATDGAVVIKGAEGKNVVIATILGKVVANETINSDNETIAVPAGIAVVSVDGESFKVVVK